jgi:hypothetical protein
MDRGDHVPGAMTDMVALMYRADWARLSLAATITEFEDFSARS